MHLYLNPNLPIVSFNMHAHHTHTHTTHRRTTHTHTHIYARTSGKLLWPKHSIERVAPSIHHAKGDEGNSSDESNEESKESRRSSRTQAYEGDEESLSQGPWFLHTSEQSTMYLIGYLVDCLICVDLAGRARPAKSTQIKTKANHLSEDAWWIV